MGKATDAKNKVVNSLKKAEGVLGKANSALNSDLSKLNKAQNGELDALKRGDRKQAGELSKTGKAAASAVKADDSAVGWGSC